MRLLKASPMYVRNLPFKIRLATVFLSFLLCMGLFAIFFPIVHNGTIMLLSVLMATWFFGYRGALLSMAANLLVVPIIVTLQAGTIFWPQSVVVTFGTGIASGVLVGLVFGYLRHTADVLEDERLRTLQAEQQKIVAYQQRLEALHAEQQMTEAYQLQRQMNRLKDQFILNVNHELRTPLTEVYGYLELLSVHKENLDEALKETFLSKAKESCEELMKLVNNVLAATQANSELPSPQVEEILLTPLVHSELEHLVPQETQEHPLHVDLQASAMVRADPQYMRQILRNLLSNAFKYSPPGTPVLITAQVEASTPSEICICVKDSGPGIPPGEIPLLFERFVRLKRDLSGSVRGSGLGLYISRQLVEAMGGRIWVESSGIAGEGSRFCFTLPAITPPGVDKLHASFSTPSPTESHC